MRKIFISICATALVVILLASGCYQPGGPVPGQTTPPVRRDYTQEDVDRTVVMEEQVIPAPLPREWGAPPECDEIHFLRFRPADGSTLDPNNRAQANASTTDAMLVMLPGVLEGANGFEYIGRNLVYQAKVKDGKNFEVWAIERRNNRLDDLSAVNYIQDQFSKGEISFDEGVDEFIGYYYKGEPLNGKTFKGWYTNEQVPFLSNFGLKLDTEDVFKVIQTLVPDPAVRKKKVFVGGHSMGGMMTSNFAGWDLDGDPATTDDAGYNNCAGMFGLDTVVNSIGTIGDEALGMLPPDMAENCRNMTEDAYENILAGMREGWIPVILNSGPLLPAESMTLLDAVAMTAYYDPQGEDTYINKVPFSDDMRLLLKFLNSKDYDAFCSGVPDITNFRFTNEALLGVFFDDSFAPCGMILNSMGFLTGGPVVLKEFPTWPAAGIPGLDNSIGKGPYWIPNDAGPADDLGTGPLYSWANFDEIGDSAHPDFKDTTGQTTFTTMENEVTDIRDVARLIFKAPLDLTEWYFSSRLLADLAAGMMPWAPKYGINFLHGDKLIDMPQVVFIAEQGMMSQMDINGLPGEKHFLKGYNHMDVLTACANASGRRPNEVIRPLIDFVEKNAK
jgi:pimeloyl-ACP methyl ester carboxylesterase